MIMRDSDNDRWARRRTYPGEFVGLLHVGKELHLDVAQVEHLRLPLIHRP